MSKKDYDDLDELFNDLENEITNSMLVGSVNKVVKETYRDNVDRMYDEYESSYERRGNDGGFGDIGNLEEDISVIGNSFEYTLINETEAVNDTRRLDYLIEEGIYDYGNAPSRPVYSWTNEELNSGLVEKALERDLKDWL